MTEHGRDWGIEGNLILTFSVPIETPSNNVIKGMHFHVYKNLRRQWKKLVTEAVDCERMELPIKKAFLVIERHCAGGGLDWDNAYGGLKPLLDCLVVPSARNPDGLGIILDDNPKAMPIPPYVKQCQAKPGFGKTVVFIYELP